MRRTGFRRPTRAQEFRAVWKREKGPRRTRVFCTRQAALRFLVLFGPEPWRAFGEDPDALFCCSGRECGCRGLTVRQNAEEIRHEREARDGPMQYVRLEKRGVMPWLEEKQP